MKDHGYTLKEFNGAVSQALRRSFSHYLQFIPAVIWTWFAVEVAVPALEYTPSITLLILLPIGLIGYAAAAAKASGRYREDVMQLYLTRFCAILDYWWLYSCLMIGSFVLTIALSFFGDINHGGFISNMLPLYGVLFVLFCMRCWPMVVAPFSNASTVPSPSILWKLPGLGYAWSLTRNKHTFLYLTAPLFCTGGLICGAYAALRLVVETYGLSLMIPNLLLYGVALPFFITLIDILVAKLEPVTGKFVGLNDMA
jgi:hypothetical protein